MTSNSTTIFLWIKPTASTDSGLYFCGSYAEGRSTVIVHGTYLKVQEMFDEQQNLIIVMLGGLIISPVIVIICLIFKIRKLHTAHDKRHGPQPSENLASDALNYAALSFKPRTKTNSKPPTETELETNVVYAATR
ncbi:hypothetical protein Q5P01_000035 [Channa striata]|uniref:Uncharacterized protein n=1 Tax=Channa striata TaxID=64152 RepID=A0AA88IHU6_CHASR|nr:hypothetical protein Q5P01_000035 [Channa striata]